MANRNKKGGDATPAPAPPATPGGGAKEEPDPELEKDGLYESKVDGAPVDFSIFVRAATKTETNDYLKQCFAVALATGGVTPNTVLAEFIAWAKVNAGNDNPTLFLCAVMGAVGNVKRNWNAALATLLRNIKSLPSSFVSSNGANFKGVTMLAYLLYMGLGFLSETAMKAIDPATGITSYKMLSLAGDNMTITWNSSIIVAMDNFVARVGSTDIRAFKGTKGVLSDRQQTREAIYAQAASIFAKAQIDRKKCELLAWILVVNTQKVDVPVNNNWKDIQDFVPTEADKARDKANGTNSGTR